MESDGMLATLRDSGVWKSLEYSYHASVSLVWHRKCHTQEYETDG